VVGRHAAGPGPGDHRADPADLQGLHVRRGPRRDRPDLDAAVDLYIDILESLPRRLATTLVPFAIPGLAQRGRLREATATIDARIRTIADGTAAPPHYSLAEAVLREVERAGLPRDPELVRDFVLQLHFAGLTSVASTIVWSLLLLSLHPAQARQMLDQLHEAAGGRVPTPEDVKRLPYVEAVLNESIRLYPAAAWEFKRTLGPLDLGGHRLPEKSQLIVAPWVTQRSPRSFEDPLLFRPERFLGRADYDSGSFLPWGTGERSCIGKSLARNAFRSVVGGIVQRFRLDLVPDQHIEPHPGYLGTRVLPRPGVLVVLAAQDGDTERSAARVHGSVVGAVPGTGA